MLTMVSLANRTFGLQGPFKRASSGSNVMLPFFGWIMNVRMGPKQVVA